ncbi:FecR family protein [Xanthovirga aplysinae]|uniref:FecR family protein n=1 Tax=Xanthovirga aplysinae TaxID=2529853 RepID=UPI0012BB92E0|nr:FecR domain-containing protein [Xanthovirga aplysinae]MTI30869.1 DUF4974 domain-containing protein [Xanthovirga aplysinae]
MRECEDKMDKPDYENYTVEDFVSNEYFRYWVLHESEECGKYWQAWLKKYPEKKAMLEEAREIILSQTTKEREEERIWSDVESQVGEEEINEKEIFRVRKPRRSFVKENWKKLIFLLVLFFAGIFYLTQRRMEITVQMGEQKNFIFPDGSEMFLNADSKSYFEVREWSEKRVVHLLGEAFFQMEKGNPFTILTPLGVIKGDGGKFNVYSRHKRLSVDCYQGELTVKSKIHGVTKTIKSGEGVVFTDDLINTYSLNYPNGPSWPKGVFQFEDAPLIYVFKEIERQYAIKIKVAVNLGQLKYTGEFTDMNLKATLDALCEEFDLNYEFYNGNRVIITRK